MSSTSSSTANNNKRDLGEEYGADIQLLEGMPTKIRRLTYENDLLRQERAKDKLQLTAKDSVIAILIASLKESGGAPAPAPAPASSVVPQQPVVPSPVVVAAVSTGTTSTRSAQVSILAPLSPAKPATTKVHAATSPMPAATVVVAAESAKPSAPVAAAVPAKTSTTQQQQRPPTTTPVAAAKTKSTAVPAAAPKPAVPVAATAAAAPKKSAAAPTPIAPKPLKLQHPAVAVPEVDDCSEYGEEEEEEEVPAPAPAAAPAPVEQQLEEDDGVEDQDEEEEEDEVQVVSVKYSPSKLPKDFFYVASTQKLYRIKYDEDGDQEVGEMVATYDLATKRITERFVATL